MSKTKEWLMSHEDEWAEEYEEYIAAKLKGLA